MKNGFRKYSQFPSVSVTSTSTSSLYKLTSFTSGYSGGVLIKAGSDAAADFLTLLGVLFTVSRKKKNSFQPNSHLNWHARIHVAPMETAAGDPADYDDILVTVESYIGVILRNRVT
jgi:hypothetical protein